MITIKTFRFSELKPACAPFLRRGGIQLQHQTIRDLAFDLWRGSAGVSAARTISLRNKECSLAGGCFWGAPGMSSRNQAGGRLYLPHEERTWSRNAIEVYVGRGANTWPASAVEITTDAPASATDDGHRNDLRCEQAPSAAA